METAACKDMETYRVVSFADIVRALKTKPEWLEEIRKIILTSELMDLPRKFDELLKKVEKLEEDVVVLKQDVATLKQDVAVLKEDVAILKQDVDMLKQDVAVLKQDVDMLKQDVAVLKKDMAYLKGEFGRFKGKDFERTIRERYPAYFGRILRKCRIIDWETLLSMADEAEERGLITEQEREDLLRVDLVVKGEIRKTRKPVILVVEVSYALHEGDLQRARKRGEMFSRFCEEEVIPVVIGTEIKDEIERKAEEEGILVIKTSY
ncbi:hypothetical protein [Thermosulfurimonas sp. F29]|uniref:hypothetical protein n=1 Tax=Thermosulfurimonas sp. F29 TaxID=2867247 RepID=UPI001C831E8D|nr:hypothetical protein [Thermosulfurimonas sp. F29]MBX6423690.1 hypothetical protein [Thermosulfurimonas sp. F29]